MRRVEQAIEGLVDPGEIAAAQAMETRSWMPYYAINVQRVDLEVGVPQAG